MNLGERILQFVSLIPEKITFTIFKLIFSIFASIFLILEGDFNTLLFLFKSLSIAISCSYAISIILLNIARYIAKKTHLFDTAFNTRSTIFYYINIGLLILLVLSLLTVVTIEDKWNLYYYLFSICFILLLLLDEMGILLLSIPIIMILVVECLLYYLVKNSCCEGCFVKRIIPGVDCPPNLFLKEHQHVIGLEDLTRDVCPICLGALSHGQHVIYLPCGEKHIFHRHCIAAWLLLHNHCPTCRAQFHYQNDISLISEAGSTYGRQQEISMIAPETIQGQSNNMHPRNLTRRVEGSAKSSIRGNIYLYIYIIQ